MSYPPSSPDGALIQIGLALGRLEGQLTGIARSLDHLILTLQRDTQSKTSGPVDRPASKPSLLATVLERVSKKVLMDLIMLALKAIARSALPYLIPWSAFIGGLVWLGSRLLKFLGLS